MKPIATCNIIEMTDMTITSELYVWKLWDLGERHLTRQQKRGKKYDPSLTTLFTRELHFALAFNPEMLTDG